MAPTVQTNANTRLCVIPPPGGPRAGPNPHPPGVLQVSCPGHGPGHHGHATASVSGLLFYKQKRHWCCLSNPCACLTWCSLCAPPKSAGSWLAHCARQEGRVPSGLATGTPPGIQQLGHHRGTVAERQARPDPRNRVHTETQVVCLHIQTRKAMAYGLLENDSFILLRQRTELSEMSFL